MEHTTIKITKEANRKLAIWQIQNNIKSRSKAIEVLLERLKNELLRNPQ